MIYITVIFVGWWLMMGICQCMHQLFMTINSFLCMFLLIIFNCVPHCTLQSFSIKSCREVEFFFLKHLLPSLPFTTHTHTHPSNLYHVRQQKHKGKTPSKSQIHQKICCEHTKIIWNTMKVTIVLVNWWHFGMGWCRVDVERVAVLRVGRRALLWPVNYKICAVAPMKDVLKFISWKIFG